MSLVRVDFEGEGGHVAPLAIVIKQHEGAADLAVMDSNGAWGIFTSVPRNDEGGGVTYRPHAG